MKNSWQFSEKYVLNPPPYPPPTPSPLFFFSFSGIAQYIQFLNYVFNEDQYYLFLI